MIPDEAVEAARDALWNAPAGSVAVTDLPDETVRIILEAAAPHLTKGAAVEEAGELARLLLADAYALQSKPGMKDICQHLTDGAIAIDRLTRKDAS